MTVWVKGKGRVTSYMLPPTEHDQPIASGEGLTRTSATITHLYHLMIWFGASKPMRATIRATTKREAELFARNRHPTLTRLEFD